jgi:hypothetical protein
MLGLAGRFSHGLPAAPTQGLLRVGASPPPQEDKIGKTNDIIAIRVIFFIEFIIL